MAFGLDDAIGAGIGIFGNLLSGQMNANASMERQDSANAFSAQQYATRYQTTVKDMAAAGLNPMLAYSQGAGSAPSGAISNASPYGNFGDSANQGRLTAAQVANTKADTENKAAAANLMEAQAAQAWSTANQSNENVSLIRAQVDKTKQDFENAKTENDRIKAVIDNLRVTRDNLVKEGYNLTETGNVLRAQVSKMMAEIPNIRETLNTIQMENFIKGEDVEAIKKTGGIGRIAREVKPASDIAADWLNPIKWFTSKSKSESTSNSTSTIYKGN